MTQQEALEAALVFARESGFRFTVRGLRFRDGWQYYAYEAGGPLDRGIRSGDLRRFWEYVKAGSPGLI